jgi:hypothetical protein
VERERSSKYFCNLKKRHFTEKAIPKLILDNGFEITNQDDILTQQHIFYEALYTNVAEKNILILVEKKK